MKVSDLGEFGLIDRLADILAAQGDVALAGRLAVGIGDDAAVWRGDHEALIATTDALVAGVHFLPDKTPWRDLGWKALAANVSDVAAMGGTPDFALVTLALHGDEETSVVDALYQGLAEAGRAWAVAIAGGDIVRAPATAVSIALIGHAGLDGAGEPLVLRRDAARAGDVVAVTGALGGAAGGLLALREGRDSEDARVLIARHLRPEPRLEAGRAALAAGVRCAIDISDGLLQDLGHVCKASHLGAAVWRDSIPLEPALLRELDAGEALRCAVAGGEDYELLLVGAREQIEELQRAVALPVTVIGEMVIATEHTARLLDEAAQEIDVPSGGWDHLRGDG